MTSLVAIGAGLAALTGIGAGVGIGIATSKATDAIARQPEAEGKITKALLLGCALAEGTAIFGMVVAILIIAFIICCLYRKNAVIKNRLERCIYHHQSNCTLPCT